MERCISGGRAHEFLDTQYRMHPSLSQVKCFARCLILASIGTLSYLALAIEKQQLVVRTYCSLKIGVLPTSGLPTFVCQCLATLTQ